jgi:archaellum component FlaC
MADLFGQLLQNTAAWVGTLMTIAGGVGWLLIFAWKRVKAVSDVSAREALEPFKATLQRLEKVEEDVHQTTSDVASLRTSQGALSNRIGRIETTLESVARKEDVSVLYREFVEFRGGTASELRQISSMVHSITTAILRSGDDKK